MTNNLFDFVNWVQSIMLSKNISQADIARTGYVKTAAVSMFFSYKTKSVGVEMCKAVAAATGVPVVTVMEKAGILTPQGEMTPKKRQLLELAEKAEDRDIDSAIAVLEASVNRKYQK